VANWTRKEFAAEGEKLVERVADQMATADQVAEIDDPVAGLDALAQHAVQGRQTLRLAMDGSDGPDAPGPFQERKCLPIGGHGLAGHLPSHGTAAVISWWSAAKRQALTHHELG
jgi:hypothetical protein